jgi:hypothetical protein
MDVPGTRTSAGLAPNERVLQGIPADTRVLVSFVIFQRVRAFVRAHPTPDSPGNLGNPVKRVIERG